MGTPANSRRRILSREMSEDENMMMVIKEADAKFNARQASFAEAKEAGVKKLMRQQQEDTREDFEEKYMDAVQSIGHLETEKTLLVYEVEQLRDILEGTEEELAELHRKNTQISRELETVKVAKHVLQQKINCMEEQLEERKESKDTEIAARDLTGGRAQDKWLESGREGGEVTKPFQFTEETVSNFAKDVDSVTLKRDVWLDKDEQHEGMHGKEVFEDEEQLENENPVKNQELDRRLQGSIDKVNDEQDSRTREKDELREGENAKEKVDAREGLSQGDNGEKDEESNETNIDLDMGEQKTVMDGQARVEGKETQNESGSEQNNEGKEKGAIEMLKQLTKKIVTRQKNFTESEGTVNREDHIVGHRGETDGETEEELKEQNEEYVCGGIEEKTNQELSRKGLVGGVRERPVPEGTKAATELIEEAEGVADDLSDEEMHDAAESIVPEPKSGTHAPERNSDTEDEPEGTATNDDTELGEKLSASESTKRPLKHQDTCQVS